LKAEKRKGKKKRKIPKVEDEDEKVVTPKKKKPKRNRKDNQCFYNYISLPRWSIEIHSKISHRNGETSSDKREETIDCYGGYWECSTSLRRHRGS